VVATQPLLVSCCTDYDPSSCLLEKEKVLGVDISFLSFAECKRSGRPILELGMENCFRSIDEG
jgi:hypothetical protein